MSSQTAVLTEASQPLDVPSNLIINARFLTQRLTGVQRYAYEVAKRLGSAPMISPGQPLEMYSEHGASRVVVASSKVLRSHLWDQVALPRHVPHGSLLFSPGNVGPLTVSNQVLTIHDLSPLEHPEWFSRSYAFLYSVLLPRLATQVRHILTDSEYSRGRIIEVLRVPEDKVTSIPLAVDERFSPAEEEKVTRVRTKYGLERKYVLVVGSLDPRKNLGRLIKAWPLVAKSIPDVDLVIAGGSATCFADFGISSDIPGVRFLGYVGDNELPALYTGAQAFVYPSLYEGFGMPPLEAMRCGTPVVVSDRTSLPEAVGNCGVYVDPFSETAIAEGLTQLLSDEVLQANLARAGRAWTKGFAWENTARRTLDVLRRFS